VITSGRRPIGQILVITSTVGDSPPNRRNITTVIFLIILSFLPRCMHATRSSYEKARCSPSVCQMRGLWQSGRKICPYFIPFERSFILVFWEKEWLLRGRGEILRRVAMFTWPKFQIFGPPIISGTAEDTNLKFCMRIDRKGYWIKKWKIVQKWAWVGHVTYFSNFGSP